jgi:hypothetical protein
LMEFFMKIARVIAVSIMFIYCLSGGAMVDAQTWHVPPSRDSRYQIAELTSPDPSVHGAFGIGLAADEDTVVVGTPYVNGGLGAAYVYVEPPGGWVNMKPTATLTASDANPYCYFGWSVSMQGDTIVVGAITANIGSNQAQGAVYIFVKPADGWHDMTETAKLTASDGAAGDSLGTSVAISNGTVVSGAYAATTFGQNLYQGAAYVFVKPVGGWKSTTETAKLTASDAVQFDDLGYAVAINDDTIVATAVAGYQNRPGRAYVYVKPLTGWLTSTQTAELTATDVIAQDYFAVSAVIRRDTIAVGSWFGPSYSGIGQVYVYVEPNGAWKDATQTAELKLANFRTAWMGYALATNGQTIIAGATAVRNFRGAAFFYSRPSIGWQDMTQTGSFAASDSAKGDDFGTRVAYAGNAVVISAVQGDLLGPGKVYIFVP